MKGKKLYAVATSLLLAGLVAYLWPEASDDVRSVPSTSSLPVNREDGRRSESASNSAMGRPVSLKVAEKVDPATNARRKELARLKKAWLALGPGDQDMERRDALQKESIETLMCSLEMHELSTFLEEQGIRVGTDGGFLDMTAPIVFSGPNAEIAIQIFLESIPSLPPDKVMRWSESAGRRSDMSLFDDLFSKLSVISPSFAAAAMYGRCEVLVKTDPVLAVQEMLRAIGPADGTQDDLNNSRFNSLLMSGDLPRDTNFEAIAKKLEASDPEGSRFPTVATTLFTSWGERDPAAAANYILAAPERYPSELITIVASRVGLNAEQAKQWVESFPQGKYRDAALLGCIEFLDMPRPDAAKPLVPLIEDPKIRAQAQAKILSAERTIESGDKY